MTFESALKVILRHEGGYVDHPEDPGGATRFGITLNTLKEFRGHRETTKEDVQNLSTEEAGKIYRIRYWNHVRCDEMPPGLALCVFDSAVNQGPKKAAKLLQRALNVPDDGIIGPVTLRQAKALNEAKTISEFMALRAVHYAKLNSLFHLGWYRRLMSVYAEALTNMEGSPCRT